MTAAVDIEEYYRSQLVGGPCTVTFTKVDGSTRVMKCTLRPDALPPVPEGTEQKKRVEKPGLINVFDLESNDWRSFRVASVQKFVPGDEAEALPIEEPKPFVTPGGTMKFADVSVQYPFWGYHIAFDCGGCDKDDIRSKENIEQFSSALVKAIDMVAYGGPQVVHFAGHNPAVAGFTLTQLIETSLVSGHFVDATGECYIDVFSCAPFDAVSAEKCIRDYFNPRTVNRHVLLRKAL